MKSKWVTYKGKRIFYSDLANFGTDVAGLRAELEAANSFVSQEPENSAWGLMDIRNTVVSLEVVQIIKEFTAKSKYVRKAAVVGIGTGFRQVLFDAVVRAIQLTGLVIPIATFDDVEKAQEWLVEETT